MMLLRRLEFFGLLIIKRNLIHKHFAPDAFIVG